MSAYLKRYNAFVGLCVVSSRSTLVTHHSLEGRAAVLAVQLGTRPACVHQYAHTLYRYMHRDRRTRVGEF
jgi:hypothetical protein